MNFVSLQNFRSIAKLTPRDSDPTTKTTVKNIVLTGFGEITLLDLDTIDLSNLNRQFLFKKKDVKQSKAMVSANLVPKLADIRACPRLGFRRFS